jgi:hypothetical protein
MKRFATMTAVVLLAAGTAAAQTTTTPPATQTPGASQTAPTTPDSSGDAKTTPMQPAPGASDSAATTAMPDRPTFLAQQATDQVLASDIIGMAVKGTGDEDIGNVNDVVIGNDGMADAIVIGVGGFLGIGEKDVAVAYNDVEVSRDADDNYKLMLRRTKAELEAAPDFRTLSDLASESTASAPAAGGSASATAPAKPDAAQ